LKPVNHNRLPSSLKTLFAPTTLRTLALWSLFWGLVLLILAPIVTLFTSWQAVESSLWQHLVDTLLSELVLNTLTLLISVGIGTAVLGVSMAWLVTRCEFSGRGIFEWLLFLPFAVPAYVLAFVFLGVFDYSGPLQETLRAAFSWQGGLDIREGVWGIALTMSLVFYPYVYLLARSAFLSQPSQLTEVSQSLGASPTQSFFKVSLPMARPAIAAGVTLALMEVLADFGTVSIFNYDTFTTAIYSSWVDYRSLETAAQLSTLLVFFAAILILLEQFQRGRKAFDNKGTAIIQRYPLSKTKSALVIGYLSFILLLAFIIPLVQLSLWTLNTIEHAWDSRYWSWLSNSLLLAISAAFLTVLIAVIFNIITHNKRATRLQRFGIKATTLGYALPGSVLAIGVMSLLVSIQNTSGMTLWLSSSLIALVLAYIIRFMAVAYGPVESGFKSIKPSINEAARNLGASPFTLLQKIYWPLLKPGLLTALFLVTLDILKELPATYLLRRDGWDTLTVRTYELSAEGLYEEAAIPALMLLLIGLIRLMLIEALRQKTP